MMSVFRRVRDAIERLLFGDDDKVLREIEELLVTELSRVTEEIYELARQSREAEMVAAAERILAEAEEGR